MSRLFWIGCCGWLLGYVLLGGFDSTGGSVVLFASSAAMVAGVAGEILLDRRG